MLESKLTSNFLKEKREQGYWAFKLPDIWRTIKPYDFIMVSPEWETYHCEAKIISNKTLHFSKIRNNQWTALKRIHERGAKAYILVWEEGFESFFPFSDILDRDSKWETKMTFK